MRKQLIIFTMGTLLGLFALAAGGRLCDADAMPPYPELNNRSPRLAAAVDRYRALHATFAERGIDQPGGGLAAGTQLSGSFNMLAICVEFTDHPATVPAMEFDTLIFSQTVSSVRQYYEEVSYGTFTIVTVNLPSALGWQTAPSPYSYYVNNSYGMGSYPQNSQKLCEDLVDMVDSVVDFSQYDNDGNGTVDGLIIVHSGTGAELSALTTDIWSHKWNISPRLKDGVYISAYSIQPEYWLSPGDITIGVYAHELGHVFGLPDLYDIDNSSRGLGRWSLMASGSWNGALGASPAHLDAWCRAQLGFVTPTVVNSNITGATVPAIEDSAKIYRLWSDGAGGSEYFLIENRQKTGYDSYIPGSGLLIWHIDETKTNNNKEWYPGHTSSGNYKVALMQPDNLWELEKNIDYGDSGDPFPGSSNQTFFSAASLPSSDDYSGQATYVTVTNISSSAPVMTCDFAVSLGTGILDNGEDNTSAAVPTIHLINRPNPFNPSTVIHYNLDRGGPVELGIYDVLGRRVTRLVNGHQDAGQHEITWNGTDDAGRPVASGVYFGHLATSRSSTVNKMVLVR